MTHTLTNPTCQAYNQIRYSSSVISKSRQATGIKLDKLIGKQKTNCRHHILFYKKQCLQREFFLNVTVTECSDLVDSMVMERSVHNVIFSHMSIFSKIPSSF